MGKESKKSRKQPLHHPLFYSNRDITTNNQQMVVCLPCLKEHKLLLALFTYFKVEAHAW